jgi:hypothetical protein
MTHALDRLAAALADPQQFAAAWSEDGRIEGDVLCAWAGRPSPASIAALEAAHVRALDLVLDADLRALWERFDGIAIGEPFDEAPTSARGEIVWADVDAIGEPGIWPAMRYDHFALLDIELELGASLVAFGEIADSGWFALGVGGDVGRPSPVYWQDSELHLVRPHFVAPSLAEFMEAWIAASLSLPRLLRACAARGWGT